MKARIPLYSKILALAFLNLCLLGLALALIARAQFRLDPGSFLLAPAQSRIIGLAHAVALEMEVTPASGWDDLLSRYAQAQRIQLAAFDEMGDRVAGPEFPVPREIADRIPRRQPPRDGPPPPDRKGERGRGPRAPGPPLFLSATSNPAGYWAGVRIPIRTDPAENPHPGTLLMMSPTLLGSPLFFDVKPWLTIGVSIVLISVACWLPFIRGITRSISQMTRAAGQIAEGRFDVNVPERRRDEIGQLGAVINRMSGRLEGYVNGQKAFLSGIAHELCNPIATIQFGLGNLERRVEPEQRTTVADIQEEVDHMSSLVNELLSFSRAGMKGVEVQLSPVSVAATVARVLEREPLGDAHVDVALDENLQVLADAEYLFRALSNLVRNAVRYAGKAGPIRIGARKLDHTVLISVADSGPGVPAHALEDVFAPFYRVDVSRNHQTGGVGLGLAIVRACIESCRGAVTCRNLQPTGLEVEIRLAEAAL